MILWPPGNRIRGPLYNELTPGLTRMGSYLPKTARFASPKKEMEKKRKRKIEQDLVLMS